MPPIDAQLHFISQFMQNAEFFSFLANALTLHTIARVTVFMHAFCCLRVENLLIGLVRGNDLTKNPKKGGGDGKIAEG